MPGIKVTSPHPRRIPRFATIPLAVCLLLGNGCKSSDDAAAAATQLTATASALTGYYAALGTLLAETDQLYQIQAAVEPIAPYDPKTKSSITDTEAEIAKRERLAACLTTLAEEFAKLSGSTAHADASAAAGNLESAVAGLKLSNVSMSSSNVNVMKEAVDTLVKAIQERKEREAAQAIDRFSGSLTAWFQSEEPLYDSIGAEYAGATDSLAKALIRRGQVDSSSFLDAVFSPYGLTPQLTDPTIKANVQAILAAQVDQKSEALAAAQRKATGDMEKSLKEIETRIHLVASDQPMHIRMAPIALTEVQAWLSTVTSMAPAVAAKSSASTTRKN